MGSDIHMYSEYLYHDEWKSADYFMISPDDISKYYVVPIYDERNYDLFGILVGIRSNVYDPIDVCRGVPCDSCVAIRTENKEWGNDAHTHSWLTYAEIIERIKSDCPDGNYSQHILYYLATKIANRIADIFYVFEYDSIDDAHIMKYANDFRIVFWFDS